jgi:hypothetical protein
VGFTKRQQEGRVTGAGGPRLGGLANIGFSNPGANFGLFAPFMAAAMRNHPEMAPGAQPAPAAQPPTTAMAPQPVMPPAMPAAGALPQHNQVMPAAPAPAPMTNPFAQGNNRGAFRQRFDSRY